MRWVSVLGIVEVELTRSDAGRLEWVVRWRDITERPRALAVPRRTDVPEWEDAVTAALYAVGGCTVSQEAMNALRRETLLGGRWPSSYSHPERRRSVYYVDPTWLDWAIDTWLDWAIDHRRTQGELVQDRGRQRGADG